MQRKYKGVIYVSYVGESYPEGAKRLMAVVGCQGTNRCLWDTDAIDAN